MLAVHKKGINLPAQAFIPVARRIEKSGPLGFFELAGAVIQLLDLPKALGHGSVFSLRARISHDLANSQSRRTVR